MDGHYVLTVPSGASTLVFSFIGMTNQEVPINGQTKINVNLVTDVVSMDEFVVIAYGTAKKSSLTGASVIDGVKIAARPLTNLTKVIEGTNPGIQITSAS